MRVAQISDTHLGITTEGQLKVMLKKLKAEDDLNPFDVLVHCGDWCGTLEGWRTIKNTLPLIRRFFPDKPIVATIGNHDFWCYSRKAVRLKNATGQMYYGTRAPGPEQFFENLKKIKEEFAKHGVHYLDEDGIYVHPDNARVVFAGVSGWYSTPNPRTNDGRYMAIGIDGDTHAHLRKRSHDILDRQVTEQLKDFDSSWQTLLFITHFPVINMGNDYKGCFEDFSWSEGVGDFITKTFGCRHFLCGHAHQKHSGPLRYECGPDYYRPAYQIIEV